MELSKNKTGKVTAEAHLLLTAEIVNSVQQIRIGGLLNANYNLGLIWGIDCITILVLLVKMKMAIYDLMHLIHCTHWKILYEMSLLQCQHDDFILSIATYKSSLHFQCPECHNMLVKRGAIVSKLSERFKSSKKKIT